MFKLDNELIKDRFVATSFSFYTEKEIEKLAVKQILNPTAFDHLNNPTNGGIYDKTLGVSPFDHRAQCVTCGLDSQYCPGHLGYIELTGPCYNPFLINQLYKLLKSKCVKCHRIRIHPKKIDMYVQCMKLIKSGQIVGSQVLKNYFLNAAKETILLTDQTAADNKKLAKLRQDLDKMLFCDDKGKQIKDKVNVDPNDYLTYFQKLDEKFNKLKQEQEEDVIKMFEEYTTYSKDELICHTSILQKTLKEINHEIWSSVVPISCPHCQEKSPAYRKDGYTKFFMKPLSEKLRNQMKQQDRLSKSGKSRNSQRDPEEGFDIINDESTQGALSRKESHNDHTTVLSSQDQYSQSALNFDDEEEEEEDLENMTSQKLLAPNEIHDQIINMWRNEKALLDIMFGRFYPVEDGQPLENDSLGPQMFFLKKILVPPNRFRPESQGAFGGAGGAQGDKAFLHAHSAMIQKILVSNLALKDAIILQQQNSQQIGNSDTKLGNDVIQKWMTLQDAINTFMDSSMAQKTADKEQNGIRQLLERKEGMFRMKMMGKRVNYGGRSVISPDPYITTDQIGVPVFMARRLTFPESVSEVNAEKLRKLVMNGTMQHPGANMIEDEETGIRTNLEKLSFDQRRGLAQLLTVGRKIVYRHLNTGDVLLVNRQPTLHKPSIMAHVARILPKEQTIRMHYANCSTYNADFDGDEMNIHFPQSYHACSEAYKLMATHKQYIVPTSGKPIRGLIQDSVVSGVFLTSKDTFLTKEIYQQLVYVGLRELIEEDKIGRIFTLPPALLKPVPRWTGKQVISTIIKNIVNQESDYKANKITGLNLDSKAKLSPKEWGSIGAEEGDVVFRDNELLLGTLDKNQFGASEFGLVHSFYEIYGSEKAGELLTSLARIFTVFLQMYGFTCGLEDLVLTPSFNKERRMIIERAHKEGIEAAAKFCGIKNYIAKQFNYSNRIVYQSGAKQPLDKDIDKFTQMAIPENPFKDKQIIQEDDPIRKRLEEKMNSSEDVASLDVELDNVMRSKMSQATSQILKVCIPDGLVRRFPRNNISAMVLTGAKGGLVNMTQISCLLGQQELEGKRVPKMQNGKTLPCYLPYDPNPRSSGYVTDRFISGLRPQDFYFHCMAGREGLIDTAVKTSRSGYLQRCLIKQLESLVVNYDMTVRDNDGSIVQFLYGEDGIDVMNSKYLEKYDFLEKNFTSLITTYNGSEIMQRVDRTAVDDYKHKCKKVLKKVKRENPNISNHELKKYRGDPAISLYHPQKYFGAISEKMDSKLKGYLENDIMSQILAKLGNKAMKQRFEPIKGDTFKKMYFLKYMKSVVHPGENVGTLAGQSVGEPSTQMTLNTFHLAGHGAANMTLGIPRLKEILMTTPTNIKTPNMIVYFRREAQLEKKEMEMYANRFKRLKLSDVTKELKVTQEIASDDSGNILRLYNITIEIESVRRIQKYLGLQFKDLVKVFSDQFIPLLMAEILKQLKKASQDQGQEDVKTNPGGKATLNAQRITKKFKAGGSATGDDGEDVQFDVENEDEIVNKASHKSSTKDDMEVDEDEDDGEDNDDIVMDCDGVQKKSKDIKGYEQEDEEDQDLIRRSSHPRSSSRAPDEEEKNMNYYCNVLREKFAKYQGYIRKIGYDDDKSMTVTLGFPLQFKKILMLTVAETILAKVLVRSVSGIDNCILVTPDKANEEPYLLVQGLNFEAFYKDQDIFDVNRIQSNDIWQIMKKYGVEAGRANLVKEVRQVFNMYGIEVNYRHLSLIGDFITFNGEYRAFNRIGMEESSSPFLKMSFETTMKYLVASCVQKDTDDLSTPASALVVGQVPKVGTGIFDIIHDPDYALA